MPLDAAAREEFRLMIGRGLVKATREIARMPDLGAREAAAGTFLPSALRDGPDELLAEALDVVAEARGGSAVLAAMDVAAPTAVAVRARVRLEELDDAPPGLGRLTVEEAWEMEADEPVGALFLLCARNGGPGRQLFSFTIETPISGGAVKDGFVTGTSEGQRFVEKLTGQLPEDVDLRPVEPAVASERVVAAAVQGARVGLSPTADGLAALTIFLRASEAEDADATIQALELGASLAERVDELEDEAMRLAVDELALEAEGWFREQGHDGEHASEAAFAVGLMGDFRAFYLGVDLTSWTARELDEFLLDWVPRKVSLSEEEVPGFPESVVLALSFLGASGRLSDRRVTSLSARVQRSAGQFAAAMADPANAGPARALFDAMTADGVEIGDHEAMQAWLDAFNARPIDERDRVLGPALDAHPPATRPAKKKARKAQKHARRRNRRS